MVLASKGKRWRLYLPAERTFEDDDLPYAVTVRVDLMEDGQVGCVGIDTRRKPGGAPVGAQRMRTLPLRRLISETIAAASYEQVRDLGGWGVPDERAHEVDVATERRRPGSPPVPDQHLRLAAEIYAEAKQAGRRDALKFTMEQLEERHGIYVGRSTVHSWIQKAKEAGSDGQH